MEKYSNNKKLNGVLNEIREDLLSIHDTEDESRKEIAHYKREFPREVDFNLAQYGNVLIYYHQVRAMYARHGYKSIDRMSDAQVWETYKRQVGYVARTIK